MSRELARDFLAIGSWVFYALVIGRALIAPYWNFALPVITAILPLAAAQIAYTHNAYAARALVLVIYTSRFYSDTIYTVFAASAYLGVLISAYAIDKNASDVIKGVLTGTAAALIGAFPLAL